MKDRVLVVGLGFVGLTLALHLARKGVRVHGVDRNVALIESLRMRKAHFYEVGLDACLADCIGDTFSVGPAEEVLDTGCRFEYCFITVGTPVLADGLVMHQVREAFNFATRVITETGTIALRSTIPVGTTRQLAMEFGPSNAVKIGFCPERTAEGVALAELQTLPQILSEVNGDTKSLEALFSAVTDEILVMDSVEEAEFIKLVNNVYRDMHFGIANVIEDSAIALGLDVGRILHAANFHYPRNTIPRPGFVGGPCLSKDAHILSECLPPDLASNVLFGRKANQERLERFYREIVARTRGQKLSCVLLSGIAFKGRPETDDTRDSPGVSLIEKLEGISGVRFFVHDFVIDQEALIQYGEVWDPDNCQALDGLVIMNDHLGYDIGHDKLHDLFDLKPDAWILR